MSELTNRIRNLPLDSGWSQRSAAELLAREVEVLEKQLEAAGRAPEGSDPDIAALEEARIENAMDAAFGLRTDKYEVERIGGTPGKHDNCEYFVLDWMHDPYAVPAALAYADACQREFPKLADDLRVRAARAKAARRAARAKAAREGGPGPSA